MATHFKVRDVGKNGTMACVVLSGSTINNGELCSHDTAAGRIKAFDGTVGDRIVGWHFGDAVTGDSGGTVYANIKKGEFVLENITVAGIAGDPTTDYGDPVYMSDENTYTLTSTGNQLVGYIAPNRVGCDALTKANVYCNDVYGLTA